jgi:hypothetical protein
MSLIGVPVPFAAEPTAVVAEPEEAAGDDDGAFELEPQADATPSTTASVPTRNERLPARPLDDAIVYFPPMTFTSTSPQTDQRSTNPSLHPISGSSVPHSRFVSTNRSYPRVSFPGAAPVAHISPAPLLTSPAQAARRGQTRQRREDDDRRNLRTPSFGHRDCASYYLTELASVGYGALPNPCSLSWPSLPSPSEPSSRHAPPTEGARTSQTERLSH